MTSKRKASALTLVASIAYSFISVVFSLVYNNFLIRTYGSEANGLISTLIQFVSLFSIIEGGYTTAAVVAIYDPFVKKDYSKLNDILYTAKKVFFRIGVIITSCVLLIGFFYIRFINSPYMIAKTYCLLLVSVMTTALSLCFASKYTILLQGSNKEYMAINMALLCRFVSWMVSIILIFRNADILWVYSTNILCILFNIMLLSLYEKKYYSYATYSGVYHKEYITGTSDVLFQKVANTIFTSTDLILISVFLNFSSASVYNLYFQVYKAVFAIIAAIAQAPFNSFGQIVNEENGRERLISYFRIYQHIILISSTVVLTVTCIMIIPFVRLYTQKITDFEYAYPILAVLFYSQIFTQIINRPYGVILNSTGNFRLQNIQCGLAAVVNIFLSLAFIEKWGMNSIIFGSFIATLIILCMNVYQSHKKLFHVSAYRAIKNIVFNYFISVAMILASFKLNICCRNYWELVIVSLISFTCVCILMFIGNVIIDNTTTREVLKFVKSMVVKRLN